MSDRLVWKMYIKSCNKCEKINMVTKCKLTIAMNLLLPKL